MTTQTITPAALALIERYVAAYNAFDVEGMLATLAADVRFENWSGGQLTAASDGRDAAGAARRIRMRCSRGPPGPRRRPQLSPPLAG